MTNKNDTSTILNLGLQDGDRMDESSVTQSDGITQAKRPRVVLGGDDGSLQDFVDDGALTQAAVYDKTASSMLRDILIEMRRTRVAVQLLLASSTSARIDLEDIDAFADEDE